jgi:pyridoxal phosphate enzyme (YggS family)
MSIADNVHRVINDIHEAAYRANRDPSEIKLVAVSKTRTAEEIKEAVEAGIVHIGENKVQEASLKIPKVSGEVIWHMVGHLQSNKAKTAASLFDWIDSVHSKKVIDIVSTLADQEKKTVKILVQVNISGEESKFGIKTDTVKDLVLYAAEKEGIKVCGLMTIGSFGVSHDVTRDEFSRMRDFFYRLKEDPEVGSVMSVLSMGMSGDFQIAIEEGSTMIRVGTAIFGKRN